MAISTIQLLWDVGVLVGAERRPGSRPLREILTDGTEGNTVTFTQATKGRTFARRYGRNSTMSRAKEASKQKKSRACAVPLLGAAGLSLSLASGASALPGGPVVDMPTQNTGVSQDITLTVEEEISDVSLATFYVFDKENVGTSEPSLQLAYWRHRHWHRGCRGCGGCVRIGFWWGGCGGCGCGGCGCGGCWGWRY